MLRGEVWLIRLDPTVGTEISKTRPANHLLHVVEIRYQSQLT